MDQLLTTKLFIPPLRSDLVARPRLIEALNKGREKSLVLISAPAGFGKTTLVCEWIQAYSPSVAWLSLDEDDSDLANFLTYMIAALQTVHPKFGLETQNILRSSMPTPTGAAMISLVNEIAAMPDEIYLVLDDHHVIESREIDQALSFMLDKMPPSLRLIITTREDPNFPLAKLRAKGQLSEIRVSDLRFRPNEAGSFLNNATGLSLSEEDIELLDDRTEGWIAGLRLAAISISGSDDPTNFIRSFSGAHHFVLDYLINEVFERQPESIQNFLISTSILDQLCGPLCDAILDDPSISGQQILEYLEAANLFLIPLDNERRWYRYHHLFADLLRQRARQIHDLTSDNRSIDVNTAHLRACEWYEVNGFAVKAFEQAAAADEIERAERLMAGDGMPLFYRGALNPVLNWLGSLSDELTRTKPSLLVAYATALTIKGKPIDQIEKVLLTAVNALKISPEDDIKGDLIGQIAAIQAMLAVPQNKIDVIIERSLFALARLHPDNISVRTTTTWSLGHAYQSKGEFKAAIQAHSDALEKSERSGNTMIAIAAATSLGQIYEANKKYIQARDNYQHVLELAGEPPLPVACEAYLGIARLNFHWNDLDAAKKYAEISLRLASLIENVDTPAKVELFLAKLAINEEEPATAAEHIANATRMIEQHGFSHLLSDVDKAKKLISQSENKQRATSLDELSDRELEILRLIADGLSNREIGDRLYLALNTVKGHNRRIFSKLQAQSRTEAIARARELNLI